MRGPQDGEETVVDAAHVDVATHLVHSAKNSTKYMLKLELQRNVQSVSEGRAKLESPATIKESAAISSRTPRVTLFIENKLQNFFILTTR